MPFALRSTRWAWAAVPARKSRTAASRKNAAAELKLMMRCKIKFGNGLTVPLVVVKVKRRRGIFKPAWVLKFSCSDFIGKAVNACSHVFAASSGDLKRRHWKEKLEPRVRIELTTDGLQNRCSTAELSWPKTIRNILCQARNSSLSYAINCLRVQIYGCGRRHESAGFYQCSTWVSAWHYLPCL